jgi:hypothetical protein
MSESVLLAHVELMTVPVMTGFPETNVNVPDPLYGILSPKMKTAALVGP